MGSRYLMSKGSDMIVVVVVKMEEVEVVGSDRCLVDCRGLLGK